MNLTGNVTLTLPTPILRSGLINGSGRVVLALPVPRLTCRGGQGNTAAVALALPVPTLAIAGRTSAQATVRITLPVPSLAVKGNTAIVGRVSLTLPVPKLSISGPNAIHLTLPVPLLSMTGRAGIAGRISLALPVPKLVIGARIPNAGAVKLTLPVPHLAVRGTVGTSASINLMLPRLALATAGHTGLVGKIALTLPIFKLDIEGHGPYLAGVTLTLPMLVMQAIGSTSSSTAAMPDGAAQPAIVMHTETAGLTQYTNFPFNSFAQFGTMYLAASAEGLFVLGGNVDDGALIAAAARVGMTDFGTSFLKRVDRSYVGYRTDGNLVVRVYTDEVDARDYMLEATGRLGLHGNHFRIGKGLRARYWQFEINNQNGSAFTLNSIELKPTQLRRRIGGGDA